MAIERYKPDDKGHVTFSYLTQEEGREALKLAIDLVAGECGQFMFLPSGYKSNDIMANHGYISFNFRGDTNALAGVTVPIVLDHIKSDLGISDDDLRKMLQPHIHRHGWFTRPIVGH